MGKEGNETPFVCMMSLEFQKILQPSQFHLETVTHGQCSTFVRKGSMLCRCFLTCSIWLLHIR